MLWKFFALLLLALGTHGQASNSSKLADEGYRSVAYYVNWAIYQRNFTPQELPANKLTHVLYAFSNINSTTGEVYLSDTFADIEKHFPGDSWSELGNNLYGCLKQLYLLKQQNRNLKTLLSIGGWTYSSNFAAPASTQQGRATFASSAVALVSNMGFDGLDIDWEYPADDTEAENMVLLLREVRAALDTYGNSLNTPYHFKLTVSCPAGPANYEKLRLADMAAYVDFWNLLAFDYTGNWSAVAGNQANLFNSTEDPSSTPFNTDTAVRYYTSYIKPSRNIVLGMPIYGRSFEATDGLGQPFDGVGPGTWEAGAYDYKALPLSGAVIHHDNLTGSSYSYDTVKRELISYDTTVVARQKAAWIQQMDLGGAMWWESSADGVGDQSLIQTVVGVLGGADGSGLESSLNCLEYLNSTFDNLRAGMNVNSDVSFSPSNLSTAQPSVFYNYSSAPDLLRSTTTLSGSQNILKYTPKAGDSFISTANNLSISTSDQVINSPHQFPITRTSTIKSTRTITISCITTSASSFNFPDISKSISLSCPSASCPPQLALNSTSTTLQDNSTTLVALETSQSKNNSATSITSSSSPSLESNDPVGISVLLTPSIGVSCWVPYRGYSYLRSHSTCPESASTIALDTRPVVTGDILTMPLTKTCLGSIIFQDAEGSTTSIMVGTSSIESYLSNNPEQTQLASLPVCPILPSNSPSSTTTSPTINIYTASTTLLLRPLVTVTSTTIVTG